MGKKNKNKGNQSNQNSQSTNSNIVTQSGKPTIVVKPSNEIVTTEEGEKLLTASLAEM